jgi:hypothetical protein
MSKEVLLAFALQQQQDEIHQLARNLVAKRDGRPWKAILHSAIHRTLQELAAMAEPDLLQLAMEAKDDLLHREARRLAAECLGKKWKKLRNQPQQSEQSVIAKTRKSLIAELVKMAALPATFRQMSLTDLKRIAADERRKSALRAAVVVPSTSKKKSPGSSKSTDYLKPMSSEYDMPEYDLE